MDKETLTSNFTKSIGEPDATTGMIGDTGLSGRTLDAYVENLLPSITDDDAVNDAFIETHVKFLKAMGGQMRHERSEFIKNHQPKPTDPKPTDPKPNDPKPNDGESELERRIKALEEERENERKNFLVKDLRGKVEQKADGLKVSNKAIWKDSVALVAYEENMTEDAMLQKAKQIYESKLKAYMGDGAKPYGGMGGGSPHVDKEAANARKEAFKAKMRAQGRLPKEESK